MAAIRRVAIFLRMDLIKAFLFSVFNRIFKIFGWHSLFINNSGLKCINQSLSSDYLRSLNVIDEINLNPANLYLGFDGLKDDYTLLDKAIKDSPHFEFVEQLFHKNSYRDTDYYQRFTTGKLDLRYNQWPRLYDFSALFKSKKEQIESDTYEEVLITKINERYYILDGKHTAALSLVMNKNIRCLLLDNPYHHPFFKSLFKKMKADEKNFSENIEFLNKTFTN